MSLIIEQALQQGIVAHKEGKFQEAERLYRAVLQTQPTHPDANHNLGLLAVSVNEAGAALPLFKTALEANPKIEQFWLSYIDALIKENQLETVKNVLAEGREMGLVGEKFDVLEAQLKKIAQSAPSKLSEKKKSLTHEEKRKKISENRLQKEKNSPSQSQTNRLLEHYQNGRYDEAEELAISITQDFPNHQIGWKVLGVAQKKTGKMSEALGANQKAVALAPEDAGAHYNLGNTLKELGRLEEAESSYRQGIVLKSDLVEAHNNLGITLQELGRLEEAEVSCRRAIALKSDYAEAHRNLGIILYTNGDRDSALESIEKASDIDPKSKDFRLLLSIMKSKKARGKCEVEVDDISNPGYLAGLISDPLILNRVVEPELVAKLSEMDSRELDKTIDARYGNGRCSPDFELFEDESPIIKTLAEDLTRIMMQAVKSDIYIWSSFFNILGAGGGTTPHKHLNGLDKDIGLDIGKQKYSLAYYLAVGDQNCSEPGILKLYDPSEDILPSKGMITIIPAARKHCAVYGGKKDRVMIGVNFYSL